MSNQVWVVGEVLIDLIPDGTERKAVVGGGPANTAKALAKLGVETQFIDGISSDKYGQMALKELHKDNVKLDFAHFSDKPTCLTYCCLSLITAGLIFGSNTIGATFATFLAHSNKTDAAGSIAVTSVPM